MFAKKNCPKNEKLYIFEKPLTMPFQIFKKFCKILNILIFNQEKLKMCTFPLTGCLQKIWFFFRKTCAIRFLMLKTFQKAKFYQNLTSRSGSKQRFSLLQEKPCIQAVCLRTQEVRIKMLNILHLCCLASLEFNQVHKEDDIAYYLPTQA